MNEENNVITMDCESVAVLLQKMRKESEWLSGFLESYRPPLDGERYLTDKEVAELLRVSRRTLQEYRNNRILYAQRGNGQPLSWSCPFLFVLPTPSMSMSLCVQQYPFALWISITYACRFSLARAFSTSHLRNTCVQ